MWTIHTWSHRAWAAGEGSREGRDAGGTWGSREPWKYSGWMASGEDWAASG